MPSTKEEIRQWVDALPDDATWEDMQYSIYVRQRIERGLREGAEGKFVGQEGAERRMDRWITK